MLFCSSIGVAKVTVYRLFYSENKETLYYNKHVIKHALYDSFMGFKNLLTDSIFKVKLLNCIFQLSRI